MLGQQHLNPPAPSPRPITKRPLWLPCISAFQPAPVHSTSPPNLNDAGAAASQSARTLSPPDHQTPPVALMYIRVPTRPGPQPLPAPPARCWAADRRWAPWSGLREATAGLKGRHATSRPKLAPPTVVLSSHPLRPPPSPHNQPLPPQHPHNENTLAGPCPCPAVRGPCVPQLRRPGCE